MFDITVKGKKRPLQMKHRLCFWVEAAEARFRDLLDQEKPV